MLIYPLAIKGGLLENHPLASMVSPAISQLEIQKIAMFKITRQEKCGCFQKWAPEIIYFSTPLLGTPHLDVAVSWVWDPQIYPTKRSWTSDLRPGPRCHMESEKAWMKKLQPRAWPAALSSWGWCVEFFSNNKWLVGAFNPSEKY